MGFLKNLASAALTGVVEGAKNGFISGVIGSVGASNPYVNDPHNEIYSTYGDDLNTFVGMPSSTINSYSRLQSSADQEEATNDNIWASRNKGMEASGNVSYKNDYVTKNYYNYVVDTPFNTSGFKLNVPTWGYDQFLQERSVWQKGLQNPFGEPGYFYFKIFFDFDTQYGLFGGILNDLDYMHSTNSAAKYLQLCDISTLYSSRQVSDRLNTLIRFVKTLSYINCNAPWFFKEIRGLDKAMIPTQKEFSKDKIIEIGCAPDAIDMRLTTLMDLYTYSCFDEINSCEIIPENLRKFNMMIMIFNTPIRHLHTPPSHSNSKSLGYKQIVPGKYENWPTIKIFSLQNCEFVQDTLGNGIPSSMSNETPFQLGKNSISIKYDKCLIYNMNEFNHFMFGSDGIYYDLYTTMSNLSVSKITGSNNLKSRFETDFHGINVPQEKYDSASYERYAHNNLSTMSSYGFGNLYGSYATKPNSAYWDAKVKWYKNKTSTIAEFGTNLLSKLLGSNIRSSSKISRNGGDGWLPGYSERGVGSAYWKAKIEKLKKGHPTGHNKKIYDSINMFDKGRHFNLRDTLLSASRLS